MNNAGYVILSRQSGLMKELSSVANNVANADTAGFRREGILFSEYIRALQPGEQSVSQAGLGGQFFDHSPGAMSETGAPFDVAINGDGYFLVETQAGERLTRAGSFALSRDGELVTPQGYKVLSDGRSPIAIPPQAENISIAPDGSIAIDGAPIGKIGIVTAPAETLTREGDNLFKSTEEPVEVENPKVSQGFIEDSNVDPVVEIARLIQVQRAYEMSQQLLQDEDERIKSTIESMGSRQR